MEVLALRYKVWTCPIHGVDNVGVLRKRAKDTQQSDKRIGHGGQKSDHALVQSSAIRQTCNFEDSPALRGVIFNSEWCSEPTASETTRTNE